MKHSFREWWDDSTSFRVSCYVIVIALLLVSVVVAVAVGTVTVPIKSTLSVLAKGILGIDIGPGYTVQQGQYIWEFRLPRVLLAAVVGAGLSIVGATLQATVRNPLADPYILGVTAGAGLGAVMVAVLGGAVLAASFWRFAAAFLGAVVALVAVVILSRTRGSYTPNRIVLAGVTLSYLFTGLTSYLIFRSDDPQAAGSILFFLLGTLAQANWVTIAVPSGALIIVFIYLLSRARALDALAVGDETARALGFEVDRERLCLMVSSALLIGVLVAVSGGVGFAGLVVPHAVRMIIGSKHFYLLSMGALVGAIFLILVDVVCRISVRPAELPIGVVTAIIGAPYFLYLLRRNRV
ncbi:iron chelate uptake ABC transporter family permease subunit [uncultured Propionibacterium sp.]|uniref:FecCD family ABC transporter permease n=1 Tax=uncultured Propionibacterium sp. TaxID=218066 RepID=UPI00292FB990|nr:iron chelate uptake ABC transporter family permease subunit [uncultured Propionibacterium sp.]